MSDRNFTQEELKNPTDALVEELKGLGEKAIKKYISERTALIG